MSLPIEQVESRSSAGPPRFRWKQVVQTPGGVRTITSEGSLPPTIEGAVIALITIARQLALDNADMRNTIDGLTERLATLSKKTEPSAPAQAVNKKGKV